MALTHVPDLDSLQLLLRVASTGSLGLAAAEHGISQPAVSARVKSMERLVGFPLVTRSARGSTLTTAGRPAGRLGARRPARGRGARGRHRLAARRPRSRLRVAASLTVAEQLLPALAGPPRRDPPRDGRQPAALNSADVAAAVLDGSADLGFVEGPRVPEGLDDQTVARDRLVVVVPPGHPWARLRRPLAPETLAGHPAGAARAHLGDADGARGRPAALGAPRGTAARAGEHECAALSGRRRCRTAVLSELAVADDVAAGRVVRVPGPRPRPHASPAGGLAARSAADRIGARPPGDHLAPARTDELGRRARGRGAAPVSEQPADPGRCGGRSAQARCRPGRAAA